MMAPSTNQKEKIKKKIIKTTFNLIMCSIMMIQIDIPLSKSHIPINLYDYKSLYHFMDQTFEFYPHKRMLCPKCIIYGDQ